MLGPQPDELIPAAPDQGFPFGQGEECGVGCIKIILRSPAGLGK
jgi:hypothetical protein